MSEHHFLKKGEPGQVLFIILISLTPFLSIKNWGPGGIVGTQIGDKLSLSLGIIQIGLYGLYIDFFL